jgi:protein-tyrosine phosphatase
MAMGLLRQRVQKKSDVWRIESAGVRALENYPAAPFSQLVMNEIGIDLSAHRARQISREMLNEFSLVLVMERGHKEALKVAFPEHAPRIYLLSEMIGESFEIPDPIGSPQTDYEETAREIDRILSKGLKKISRLAENTVVRNATAL